MVAGNDKEKHEEIAQESPEAAEFQEAPDTGKGHAHPKMEAARDKAKEKARELADGAREKFKEISQSPGFQSISVSTWVGVGIAIAFLVMMGINAINLRWWVMLPVGAAGHIVLARQWLKIDDRKSMDARVCAGAFIALALMLVYRDVRMSQALQALADVASAIDKTF